MSISIIQLGTPRQINEGLRIGTVRRPPRGVPKQEFAKRDYYDVWFPNLAPSLETMKMGKAAVTEKDWSAFARAYRKEMKASGAAHDIKLLAALSHNSTFSIGCYCENENLCHRSVLRELLEEQQAVIS